MEQHSNCSIFSPVHFCISVVTVLVIIALLFLIVNRLHNPAVLLFASIFFKVVSFRVIKTLSRVPKADEVGLNLFVFIPIYAPLLLYLEYHSNICNCFE